jgi:hypothetical protein
MEKIVTSLVIIILLAVIAFTSYLSPISLVGPVKREANERIDLGFEFHDTWIYIKGKDTGGIRVTISNWINEIDGQYEKFQSHTVRIEEGKELNIETYQSEGQKSTTYLDLDGDGIPNQRLTIDGESKAKEELQSIDWNQI